jgi:hypothetical protein
MILVIYISHNIKQKKIKFPNPNNNPKTQRRYLALKYGILLTVVNKMGEKEIFLNSNVGAWPEKKASARKACYFSKIGEKALDFGNDLR